MNFSVNKFFPGIFITEFRGFSQLQNHGNVKWPISVNVLGWSLFSFIIQKLKSNIFLLPVSGVFKYRFSAIFFLWRSGQFSTILVAFSGSFIHRLFFITRRGRFYAQFRGFLIPIFGAFNFDFTTEFWWFYYQIWWVFSNIFSGAFISIWISNLWALPSPILVAFNWIVNFGRFWWPIWGKLTIFQTFGIDIDYQI